MGNWSAHYSLEFEEHPLYLRVTVSAYLWNEEMAAEYNQRLADKAAELDAERLLIVRDIPMTLPVGSTFVKMSDFVDRLGARKIAVVNPFPPLKNNLKFHFQIAANRKANCEMFDSAEEAEKWLLDDPPSTSA